MLHAQTKDIYMLSFYHDKQSIGYTTQSDKEGRRTQKEVPASVGYEFLRDSSSPNRYEPPFSQIGSRAS